MSNYETIIIGGGPAGLAAALTLGRARRRALLLDAGSPRNAAATHIHNFVTRDGTPPAEFRAAGREQLKPYTTIEVREDRVENISGASDDFEVATTSGIVRGRRVILCTGLIDETNELATGLPGFARYWGLSIFQCPYCHGWEVRDRAWGFLALDQGALEAIEHGFPVLLRNWTQNVVVFTHDVLDIPAERADELRRAGVGIETRAIDRLDGEDGRLRRVLFKDGNSATCEILYAHPPQRQVDIVARLGLDLDESGYVRANPMTRATSFPGIYAAGDLTTRAQGAIFAAAAGTQAAGMVNHDLSMTPLRSPAIQQA